MPLPMVHLEVAVRLFEKESIPPPFLLGSIAPDSIHMRKDTTREDKHRTHFYIQDRETTMESIKETYRKFLSMEGREDWQWFVRGYFAHLLTDYFWLHLVFYKFKEAAAALELPPEEINSIYYRETDQIDFHYYQNKPWRAEIWNGLIAAEPQPFGTLLSADEINFWRFRTVHWFELISNEPEVTPQYITEAVVEAFVIETTAKVREVFRDWDADIFKTEDKGAEQAR